MTETSMSERSMSGEGWIWKEIEKYNWGGILQGGIWEGGLEECDQAWDEWYSE